MATVRIYKVAELLNTSSQEVMALLKEDHGIDVKSASTGEMPCVVATGSSRRAAPTAITDRKPMIRICEGEKPDFFCIWSAGKGRGFHQKKRSGGRRSGT